MAVYLGNRKVSLKSGCVLTEFKEFLEHQGKFANTNYTDLTGLLKFSDTENASKEITLLFAPGIASYSAVNNTNPPAILASISKRS